MGNMRNTAAASEATPSRAGLTRRHLLGLFAAGLCAGASPAFAADWPSRPIRFVVAWPPGGGTDAVARLVAAQLGTALGEGIVIENRGGADGAIGESVVRQATPDGYTFLFHSDMYLPGVKLNATLGKKYLAFDPLKNLMPVGMVGKGPYLLVTSAASKITDLKGLIDYAKQHPGKLNCGSFGPGSINQYLMALLAMKTGIQATEIPYQGAGPLLTALLAGQVDFSFVTPSPAMPLVQKSALNGIAVLSEERLPGIDIPTIKELGYGGFDGGSVYGVFAPPGTPGNIIDKMDAALKKLITSPQLGSAFAKLDIFPYTVPSRDDMAKLFERGLNDRRQLASYLGIDLR